jgi:hypothetical protein
MDMHRASSLLPEILKLPEEDLIKAGNTAMETPLLRDDYSTLYLSPFPPLLPLISAGMKKPEYTRGQHYNDRQSHETDPDR